MDSIAASRIASVNELRPPSAGRSEIRIFFVFDPGGRPSCWWRGTSPGSGTALGGTLKLIADFGDKQLKIA